MSAFVVFGYIDFLCLVFLHTSLLKARYRTLPALASLCACVWNVGVATERARAFGTFGFLPGEIFRRRDLYTALVRASAWNPFYVY